jgi:hypothetical protein
MPLSPKEAWRNGRQIDSASKVAAGRRAPGWAAIGAGAIPVRTNAASGNRVVKRIAPSLRKFM